MAKTAEPPAQSIETPQLATAAPEFLAPVHIPKVETPVETQVTTNGDNKTATPTDGAPEVMDGLPVEDVGFLSVFTVFLTDVDVGRQSKA